MSELAGPGGSSVLGCSRDFGRRKLRKNAIRSITVVMIKRKWKLKGHPSPVKLKKERFDESISYMSSLLG